MHSHKGRFEPTRFGDLTVTVDFHCHSACRFCIVQEGMNRFRGLSLERFQQVATDNAHSHKHQRVVFTGGEVTLEAKLFDYVRVAREIGGFRHVRVQTNGRRLADRAFAEKLVAAGVDELFVSLHGHDAATQDHISQREGSFDEAIAGIRNIVELGATLLTNTVLTRLNVAHLADIVDTLRPFHPVRMEFWNYLPMEDYRDELGLLSPMEELMPSLRGALSRARDAHIETVVKYVPRCLLGEHAATLDNGQPDVVIAEEFYDVYPKFACIHEARCEHAETCLGLHHPYISKFGWEEHALVPTPRTSPWEEPEHGAYFGSDRPGARTPDRNADFPAWRALVEGVPELHGASLGSLTLQRRACVFELVLGDSRVDLVLTARDDAGPALLRTASFNLHYRNLRGSTTAKLRELVSDVARAIQARDRGGFQLDTRKGLVGPEALRPTPPRRRPPA